ncbi:GNAT family N-acetyltransferase [Nocardioides insulae]|uniref:GNAT family N-acetyltransferase n=1 Tax=Nocardioides insulae TaxID=394734 RepID=UPI00040DB65E|nr:GNAT family N-acetyltransferase [Nocardioides insulae]
MSRRVVALTLDRLAEVEAPCRTCLFWELDPVRRAAVEPADRTEVKEAWIGHVLREWGSCGRVVRVDDRPVGFVLYAPESFVAGAAAYPTYPVSPDAVLLTTIWVAPAHTGGGLGRLLIQGMASDLIQRGFRAVEAYGDQGPISAVHGSRCGAPAEFLAHVGFKTHRAHPTAPRMRMDLRGTARWRDEVEAAVERLLGAVRPRKVPATPDTTRSPRSGGM